ncbi:FAD-binding protein, partial [Streptomyces scabiei]
GAILGGRLLATFDGLRINSNMQVIRENGSAIKGLYAAGNCSGDLTQLAFQAWQLVMRILLDV